MKHRVSLPALAGAAFALSAGTALGAGPVCSVEYERVGIGEYEWRGTILADDGRLYEFAINSIAQAGTIATFAAGEGGARGAYEQLIRLASDGGAVATAEAVADLQAMVARAYDTDVTVTADTTGAGTWSILCFPADPLTDPVLIERRGDSTGLNPAADDLRAALVALDPAFALETVPTVPAAKPR